MGLIVSLATLIFLTILATLVYRLLIPSRISDKKSPLLISKKHPAVDLYSYRGLIFLSSLLIALLFAYVLIEYRTAYKKPEKQLKKKLRVRDEPLDIVLTDISPPLPVLSTPLPQEVVASVAEAITSAPDKIVEKEQETIALSSETTAQPEGKEAENKEETIANSGETENDDYEEEEIDENIYDLPELDKPASFPGGEDTLAAYLKVQYVLPQRDVQESISGTIQVAFVIERDGTISFAKAIRGLTATANAEAERVVKNMPKWLPAKRNGMPVRTRFMVHFHVPN